MDELELKDPPDTTAGTDNLDELDLQLDNDLAAMDSLDSLDSDSGVSDLDTDFDFGDLEESMPEPAADDNSFDDSAFGDDFTADEPPSDGDNTVTDELADENEGDITLSDNELSNILGEDFDDAAIEEEAVSVEGAEPPPDFDQPVEELPAEDEGGAMSLDDSLDSDEEEPITLSEDEIDNILGDVDTDNIVEGHAEEPPDLNDFPAEDSSADTDFPEIGAAEDMGADDDISLDDFPDEPMAFEDEALSLDNEAAEEAAAPAASSGGAEIPEFYDLDSPDFEIIDGEKPAAEKKAEQEAPAADKSAATAGEDEDLSAISDSLDDMSDMGEMDDLGGMDDLDLGDDLESDLDNAPESDLSDVLDQPVPEFEAPGLDEFDNETLSDEPVALVEDDELSDQIVTSTPEETGPTPAASIDESEEEIITLPQDSMDDGVDLGLDDSMASDLPDADAPDMVEEAAEDFSLDDDLALDVDSDLSFDDEPGIPHDEPDLSLDSDQAFEDGDALELDEEKDQEIDLLENIGDDELVPGEESPAGTDSEASSFLDEEFDENEPIALSQDELDNIMGDVATEEPPEEMSLSESEAPVADDLPTTEGEPSANDDFLDEFEDEGPIALSEEELSNIVGDLGEPEEAPEVEAPEEFSADDEPDVNDDIFQPDENLPSLPEDDLSGLEESPAAAALDEKSDSGLAQKAENLIEGTNINRADMQKMLAYLDGLFDMLPDAAVQAFSKSDYFQLYKKIMDDLDL